MAIARRVVDKAGRRVPVVAGATFDGGLEEQARLMNEMGKFVDTVVIITNQIAKMDEVDIKLAYLLCDVLVLIMLPTVHCCLLCLFLIATFTMMYN